MITKLPLFIGKKEWGIFFVAIIIIFCINLFLEYQKFLDFKNTDRLEVKVLAHYKKINQYDKEYYVLKCKTKDVLFYTVTWKIYDDLTNKYISLHLQDTSKITFFDYLKSFFISTKKIEILDKKDTYYDVYSWLSSIHKQSDVIEFYTGMYIDSNIDKETRESISILGIAHLIAISGFNLSILSMFIYALLYYPYKFFQQRYFPYRNIKIDVALIVLFILFWYVWFLSYAPSLLRSYVMMVVGALFFMRYIDILSFTSLGIVILIITAFAPKMLFSVSFWFSVSGVFYIYLFIHYFKHLNKLLATIFFNFWIFLVMMPIIHFYFGIFSFYQFLSPILSLIFIPFYPLTIVLHIIGYGDIFDDYIYLLLNVKDDYATIMTPTWFLIIYVCLSILSIFNKKVFILLNIFMSLFLLYCIYNFFW